jgi:hypothetical protein
MAERVLNLHVGDTMRLQRISPEFNDRYSVKLIGYLAKKSLVVTTPTVDGKVQILKEGMRFAVRILWGSDVQAFVATVLHSALKPYPHIHLSYPKDIESIAIRNAERFDTNMPGLIRNTGKVDRADNWHPILIKNLSMTGARLESIKRLGQRDEKLVLRFGVEVAGKAERIEMVADIKNVAVSGVDDPAERRYTSGVSFHQVNRFQEVLLSNCILENKSQYD